MDVAFIIDTTGSMDGAIANVQAAASTLIDEIDDASGHDFQLALVTFKDRVIVDNDLAAGNEAAVEASILGLFAAGGFFEPEASDESINTVVNGLDAADRVFPQQIGDFNGAFRAGAIKIVVLITDARPGGFDDTYTPGVDDVNAATRATEAAAAGIKIAAVFVPTFGDPTGEIVPVMLNYATTTGGSYVETAPDGTGTADAISEIIAGCGTTGDPDAPISSCVETTNPSHKNIPTAGVNAGKSGQNPDGFYLISAADAVDPDPQVFVRDAGSGTVFGPYPSGTKIKYVQATGGQPSEKVIGGGIIQLKGNGDAEVYSVDATGNVSPSVSCLVPRPPK